ncbi:MAG TPA: 23S rRNA (adenine(2503)-C(2))-methyltransferase RlmN [Ruminococcaceae bacterium]|nr:23S rRNA (adenine(2503)-C(2))-methyltransferase RlmN [Oscillospiraceae bacterium]
MSKTDIRSLTYEELSEKLSELNLPKFRTAQVYSWLYEKGVTSFDEMTNLSKDLRAVLSDNFEIKNCRIDLKQVSKLDGTVKYLYELDEGEFVECVVMKYKYGYSVCISTQLGCKMGCKFCASAIGGFKRHLTPSEMLSEIYTAQKDLSIKISHIVLMGTGEPLDNFDNVLRFLELVTAEKGLNISIRHISLSTCGIVPKIYELADRQLGLTLSVSLHAPNNELRSNTMPVNDKWSIEELLKACRYYTDKTSRRISFEYAMIKGVNDSESCAKELAKRLKGMLCHINLIPVNNVRENAYLKSDNKSMKAFIDILEKNGLTVTVRRTLGSDIDASCGQLRAKKIKTD